MKYSTKNRPKLFDRLISAKVPAWLHRNAKVRASASEISFNRALAVLLYWYATGRLHVSPADSDVIDWTKDPGPMI